MDYAALIPIVAFIVAIQIATRTNVRALVPTLVAVILPYIGTLVLNYIRIAGSDLPVLPNLFTLSSIIILLVQFALSVVIFRKVRDEDGMVATIAWGAGGALVVIFVVPFVVGLFG